MASEKDQEPAFKVVDRRRFSNDGAERDSAEPAKVEPKRETVPGVGSERPQITFSLFVQSIAHQAMFALGIMPWPDSNVVRTDLVIAQESIDVLRMAKEKTKGNLTDDENRMLDTILYELQVAFVEVSKGPAQNS